MMKDVLQEAIVTHIPGVSQDAINSYFEQNITFGTYRLLELVRTRHVQMIRTSNALGFYLPNRPLCWLTAEGHVSFPTYFKQWFIQLIGRNVIFEHEKGVEYMGKYTDEYIATNLFIEPRGFFDIANPFSPKATASENIHNIATTAVGGVTETLRQAKWPIKLPFMLLGKGLKATQIPGIRQLGG